MVPTTRGSVSSALLRGGRTRGELVAAPDQLKPGRDAVGLRVRAASLHQLDPNLLASMMDDSIWDGYDPDTLLARLIRPLLLLRGDPVTSEILLDAEADRIASPLVDRALVRLPGAALASRSRCTIRS